MSTRRITIPVGPLQSFTAARNACKLCTPLGACLAFSGVEGSVPLVHGSQGCSTYIRRYLISHFREPMDIASSNFSEHSAIFGGGENLHKALANVTQAYQPKMIGVCTTCLSETIGDDIPPMLRKFRDSSTDPVPHLVHASTPSYKGSHFDGFMLAVRSIVASLAIPQPSQSAEIHSNRAVTHLANVGPAVPDISTIRPPVADLRRVNLFPGMASPEDIRHLQELVGGFGLTPMILPDYSDRLDGATWEQYEKIPPGGTPLDDIRKSGSAGASIEFTSTWQDKPTAGAWLHDHCHVPLHAMPLPIGVAATDRFLDTLVQLSGREIPASLAAERGRLIDAFVDAHKYVFEKRAIVYGEEDLVAAMSQFLCEVGIRPVLCASGGRSGKFAGALALPDGCKVMDGVDFEDIADAARNLQPDLIIGHSKGYKLARELNVPLVRVGMPIHDRIGGSRILHLGYRGAQQLFDRIVNALLERFQDESEMGYSYI